MSQTDVSCPAGVYTDTWTRRIDAVEFDSETGALGGRRVFAGDDVPGEECPTG